MKQIKDLIDLITLDKVGENIFKGENFQTPLRMLSKSVEIEVSSGVIDSQKDKLSYPAIIKSSGILYPFSFAAFINPKHEWSLHPKIAIFFNSFSLKSRKA